jgi:hypothetical protein
VTNISAAQDVLTQHPEWCAADIPSHISVDRVVVAQVGPEIHRIHVSLELENTPAAAPAIRLQDAGDAPMTPSQALELAQVLMASAFAAVSGGAR